ncbi:MAG: hypothetical protein QXZ43_02280 [Candidatus Aenigmatarchaeota archaeon]
MKLKFLIYILLPLILATTINAKEYDSSLTVSTNEITVNQCGIATYDLTLKNTGEKEDSFYVLVEGIPEGWYSLSHESINLKPNESKNVYLFITANCFEEPKNYTGKISFLGNSESKINFKMNVVSDHKLEIIVPENISSCICEENSFIAEIHNTGKYDEDVKISVIGGNLKQNQIKLKSGEKSQIEIKIDKLCDIKPGKYNIEILTESINSYAKTKKVMSVLRENCYNFEISYPKEIRSCLNEEVKFNIALENNGIKEDDFALKIDALNVYQTMKIQPKEIKIFSVNFSSDEEGIIDIGFVVISKTKQEKGSLRFLVEKCYGVDLQPETNSLQIQQGNGKLLKAKIINTGTKEDRYKISSNINWVSIRPENITLKGSGSDEIFIYYSPEYGMKGKFDTQIKAESLKSLDIENITINVYETYSIELPTTDQIKNTTPTTTMEIKTTETNIQVILKNKTIIAVTTGILLTLIVFGLIYLFVMRE